MTIVKRELAKIHVNLERYVVLTAHGIKKGIHCRSYHVTCHTDKLFAHPTLVYHFTKYLEYINKNNPRLHVAGEHFADSAGHIHVHFEGHFHVHCIVQIQFERSAVHF